MTRVATLGAILVFLACSGGAGAQSSRAGGPPRGIPGVSYTIRVGGPPPVGGGMIAALAAPPMHYFANAIFANGRGRLDITEGGVPAVFGTGDYVLFDSTDLIVVHPTIHQFVPLPQDKPDANPDQLQAIGLDLKIDDVRVTLDSLPGRETVAGHATRHLRMTTAFTMTIQAGLLRRRLATSSTTDYWLADIPDMPGNPLLRANGFANNPVSTGLFRDLAARVDSAAALMGSAVALRTSTSSRLMQGPGAIVQTEQTSEVSNLQNREIDANLLTLPAGYTQGTLPGVDSTAAGDAAKWRIAPASGHAAKRQNRS